MEGPILKPLTFESVDRCFNHHTIMLLKLIGISQNAPWYAALCLSVLVSSHLLRSYVARKWPLMWPCVSRVSMIISFFSVACRTLLFFKVLILCICKVFYEMVKTHMSSNLVTKQRLYRAILLGKGRRWRLASQLYHEDWFNFDWLSLNSEIWRGRPLDARPSAERLQGLTKTQQWNPCCWYQRLKWAVNGRVLLKRPCTRWHIGILPDGCLAGCLGRYVCSFSWWL